MKSQMSFRCLKAALDAAVEKGEKHPEFRWKRTFEADSGAKIVRRKVSPVSIFNEIVECCEERLFNPSIEMDYASVTLCPGLAFGTEYVFFLKLQRADVQPNRKNRVDLRFVIFDRNNRTFAHGDVSFYFP